MAIDEDKVQDAHNRGQEDGANGSTNHNPGSSVVYEFIDRSEQQQAEYEAYNKGFEHARSQDK